MKVPTSKKITAHISQRCYPATNVKIGLNLSFFFRIDDGKLKPNTRVFTDKNIDNERVSNNITYCRQDINDNYNVLFEQALSEYNAHQTQITLRNSKQ